MLRPILLTLLGLGVAFLPVLLGYPDAPPAAALLLLAAGAGWGLLVWRKRRRGMPWVLGAGAALLFYAFWFFALSYYRPLEGGPELGRSAPDISATRVRDGATFSLAAQRGSGVLLVFFRGAW